MGIPTYPDDWATRISGIERRLSELHTLATSRVAYGRIESGDLTIKQGSLRILNASDQLVCQVGALPDGSYGLAAVDPSTGHLVSLSTLAFGIRAHAVATAQGSTNAPFSDLGTVGPQVTVTVGSAGRCIVIVSCHLIPVSTGSGLMGVAVSGATTISATDVNALFAATVNGGLSRVALLEGLNPGVHTITAKYSTSGSASFANRTLVALPY